MADHEGPEVGPAPQSPYRPRLIWLGVLLMLAGLLVAAAAVIVLSWQLAVIAGVLAATGALTAWRGRIFRDTHGTSPMRREIAEVKSPHDTDTSGHDPSDMGHLISVGHGPVHPPPATPTTGDKARLWGMGLLAMGVWLLFAPSVLAYPTETRAGIDGLWRDIGSGTLLILTGLWSARTSRPSKLVVAAAVAAALVLLLITETTTVPTDGMRLNELTCGILVLVITCGHTWYAYRWQDRLRHRVGPHPYHKPH
jgi:hypothetical protein